MSQKPVITVTDDNLAEVCDLLAPWSRLYGDNFIGFINYPMARERRRGAENTTIPTPIVKFRWVTAKMNEDWPRFVPFAPAFRIETNDAVYSIRPSRDTEYNRFDYGLSSYELIRWLSQAFSYDLSFTLHSSMRHSVFVSSPHIGVSISSGQFHIRLTGYDMIPMVQLPLNEANALASRQHDFFEWFRETIKNRCVWLSDYILDEVLRPDVNLAMGVAMRTAIRAVRYDKWNPSTAGSSAFWNGHIIREAVIRQNRDADDLDTRDRPYPVRDETGKDRVPFFGDPARIRSHNRRIRLTEN